MPDEIKLIGLKITPKPEKPENFFYVLRMSAQILAQMKFVPVRQTRTRTGIQRISDTKRIKEIAHYIINKDASFPNTIIVSFTGDVTITPYDIQQQIYWFTIPVVPGTAIIIDGQHRLLGIEESRTNMEILVTAYLKIPEEKQAAIFRDINFYQRKVNKSLMYDLFHVSKDAEYPLMRAVDITEDLNESGPLQLRIKLTGIGEGDVTQTIFVETLEQYFLRDDGIFRQREYEGDTSFATQTQVIKAFYESLKGFYQHVWDDPRNYILLKTQGIYSTLMVLRDILWLFHNNKSATVPKAQNFDGFSELLSHKISFKREEYGDAYLGAGGQKRLHALLFDTISTLMKDGEE